MKISSSAMLVKILLLFSLTQLTLLAFSDTLPDNLLFNTEAGSKKFNGDVAEMIMDDYFKNSGWSKRAGEVGVNGIDGLYIKKSNGVVKQVLFVESKYNTSKLGKVRDGSKQMSKQWMQHKIDSLIKKARQTGNEKTLKEYLQIRKYIEQDIYRARLWNIKPVGNGKYLFHVKDIIPTNTKNIKTTTLSGRNAYKIDGQVIDIRHPKTGYEQKIAQSIRKARILAKRHFMSRKLLFKSSTPKSTKGITSFLKQLPFLQNITTKGTMKGIVKSLPVIGSIAFIADEIRTESKFDNFEETTRKNGEQIKTNVSNISENRNYILALDERLTKEQEILGEQIETNTKKIVNLYGTLANIDQKIIQLGESMVQVKEKVDKNAEEIANIKNGILQTGLDELSTYYDTQIHDHLNNAYHDFETSLNIDKTTLKPIISMYYLISLVEIYTAQTAPEYIEKMKQTYRQIIARAEKDPGVLPVVNASYFIVKPYDRDNFFANALLALYKKQIRQKEKQNDFEGAYRRAQEVDSMLNTEASAALLAEAEKKRRDNYLANKNFNSKDDLFTKIETYHNELLLKEAGRYLYNQGYYDDLLKLLQNNTFEDSDYKLKVYLALYKEKDVQKYEQLKKLILINRSYPQELKHYAQNH